MSAAARGHGLVFQLLRFGFSLGCFGVDLTQCTFDVDGGER